jgi:diadenosine tetraphosphate (Ap4A) HIT family hydrolase
MDCVFCKIIAGEIPAKKILENDDVLVIADIAPKAPIHYLVMPKKHLRDMRDFAASDASLVWAMTQAVQEVAQKLAPGAGFNVIANNGKDVGQSVFHVHWHFLAGRDLWKGHL